MRLVFSRGDEKLFELFDEPTSSAEKHIENGYPQYLEDYNAGLIKVAEIDNS